MKWILRIYTAFLSWREWRKIRNIKFMPPGKRMRKVFLEEEKKDKLKSAHSSLEAFGIKLRFGFKKWLAGIFFLGNLITRG